jgi:feruloyl esterase
MKVLLLGLWAGYASAAAAADCESLKSLTLAHVTVTSAQIVAAGAFVPPEEPRNGPYKALASFCRVQAVAKPSADSHIEFEVWLPVSGWNGKYFGVGNGGFAGSIQYSLMAAAVMNGYASSSTDTGHKAPATDAAWALGHYEKTVDFAYRAIHETAQNSKTLIERYYGAASRHSYFSGCSNGGRQALVEAQRYPADYDGIIAGAPANFWTHNFAGFVWDEQALQGAAQIPAAKMPAIEKAALNACDAIDGLTDGLIDDPRKCHFDPSVLLCQNAESDACLTGPQAGALKKIYAGPSNSKGEQLFPGYLPGAESGPGGWSRWITGADSQQLVFARGYFANMVFENPAWDLASFHFDRDMKIADDKSARLFNATDANLKPFAARGGKLFLYHGWSDTAIAPENAISYYESVVAKMPAEAGSFVQLYMVPGMQHCAGGPGPNSFGTYLGPAPSDADHSMSMALDRWVETGAAPKRIIAAKYKTGANAASGVVRTRPLCPYPQVARYTGAGSTDEAANFRCEAPK